MEHYEVIAGSCPHGDCPTIFRNPATGTVRVRGADPVHPGQERDVEFTAAVWADLISQLQ